MAKNNKNSDNKKNFGHRKTPKDVKLQGNMLKPGKSTKIPRKNSKSEVKANNSAKEEFERKLWDIESWIPIFVSDLEEMNRNKRGRPYSFPDSLIFWMVSLMNLHLDNFRSVAGVARTLLKSHGIKTPSYSRFQERSVQLAQSFSGTRDKALWGQYGEEILAIHACGNVVERKRRVGLDSSGLSLSCPNKWRLNKWNEEPNDRGWLKLHTLADLDSGEVIAYAITTDKVGDSPMFQTILEHALGRGHVLDSVYADGAYSGAENWKFIEKIKRKNKMDFITSFRSNTVKNCNGSLLMGAAKKLWINSTFEEWKSVTGYGFRWKSECVFSDFKRIFEETVTAKSYDGMIIQVCSRVETFNLYKKTRAEIMKTTGNGVVLV